MEQVLCLYSSCFVTSTARTQGTGQRGKKRTKADWGQSWPSLAKSWAEQEPTWAQLGPNLRRFGPVGSNWAQLEPSLVPTCLDASWA